MAQSYVNSHGCSQLRITCFLLLHCYCAISLIMSDNSVLKTKRKRPSSVPGISSLALVMFMLSLLSLTFFGFKGLSKELVESSSVDVYFKDSCSDLQAKTFEQDIKKELWLKNAHLVSREEGMKQMFDRYDDPFMQYVEVAALPLSLELYIKAENATPEFIEKTASSIKQHPLVESVIYQKNLMQSVNKNIKRIELTLFVLTGIFIIIAIGLINNSTRLNIFADRFIIKSMQLVGATHGFIIKPIIVKFLGYAAIAFPISLILLIAALQGALFFVWPEASYLGAMAEITAYVNPVQAAAALLFSFACGIIIASGSAWFSTRKYLRTKIENLY